MVWLRLRHIDAITPNWLRSGIEPVAIRKRDGQTDGRTDRRTDGRTNIKFWGPSTQKALKGKNTDVDIAIQGVLQINVAFRNGVVFIFFR